MINKFVFFIVAVLLSAGGAGCAPLIVGAAAGGVGMYAASNDAIQGESDRSYETIWNSAVTVAGIRGTISKQNRSTGEIEVNADSSKVWIRVIRLTSATTRLRVAARKFKLPNLTLAQDIYLKIIDQSK